MAKIDAGTPGSQRLGSQRLGRPPGSPESIRRRRVVTLMTDAEFEELARLADEEGKSVSAFVHQIITRYLKRRN